MNKIKVIITGATGMVGEGVLLHCLQTESVAEVLMLNRRPFGVRHPKLKELIVPNFLEIERYKDSLIGYDACFFCAGISSVGMSEADYTRITYETTLAVAALLARLNETMVFNYVSGALTDAKGKQMWQRVKGRTENELMQLPFRGQYNFRPGVMTPVGGQKNVRWFFKPFIWIFRTLSPSQTLSLHEVGEAMVHAVTRGYHKQVLEISDVRQLAK
ncbi:MAG: NAD-dependent epimerase/dehydratase family protein [Cyclobacteriaceae bacterium]|nr:NAD-dependent epimerase/dehydratase family protein [Cyclobacteriaceae bacterium]